MASPEQPAIARCLERIAEAERALAEARQALSTPEKHKQAVAETPISASPSGQFDSDQAVAEIPTSGSPSGQFYCDQAVNGALNRGDTSVRSPSASRAVNDALNRSDSSVFSPSASQTFSATAIKEGMRNADPSWETCCWSSCKVPMFSPEHKLVAFWSLASFIFIMYLVFALPFTVAFDADPVPFGVLWYFNQFINVYFILDLPLNFLICYRDERGVLVRKVKPVARHYLSSWFVLDFVTAVPWDQLPLTCGGAMQMAKSVRVLRISRVLRALRLFKLLKAGSLMDRVSMTAEADPTLLFCLGLSKILFLLLSVTHWAACGWYIIGMMSMEDTSWVDAKLEGRNDITQRYLYSVYFTLTTMTTVGYGDITPQNFGEVCFVLVLLLIASLVFAGLLGALTDLVNTVSASRHNMQEKKRLLGLYGRYRELPISLFRPMRQHLLWLWETQGGFDGYEDDLKAELSPVLRRELCFHIYGDVLKSLRSAPFLSWMHSYEAVLKDLAAMISSSWLSSGDHIFRVDEPNDQIYILATGAVRLTVNERLIVQIGPETTSSARDLEVPSRASSRLASTDEDANMVEQAAIFPYPEAMLRAADKLSDFDRRRSWAAVFIQNRWRTNRKLDTKLCMDVSVRGLVNRKKRREAMTSKSVRAPAYFGEACLWYPMDTWETSPPPRFRYSARCETRTELVVVRRTQIHELLQRFSPWLGQRFNFYRDAVVATVERTDGTPSPSALSPTSLQETESRVKFSMPMKGIVPLSVDEGSPCVPEDGEAVPLEGGGSAAMRSLARPLLSTDRGANEPGNSLAGSSEYRRSRFAF